jgi:hypothetical protein
VPDPEILAEIRQMRTGYEEVYGARKTWLELNRREIPAFSRPQERLHQMQGLDAGLTSRRGQMRRAPVTVLWQAAHRGSRPGYSSTGSTTSFRRANHGAHGGLKRA